VSVRTAVFEAVRAARVDKTFTMDEVALLDDALDRLGVPRINGDADWLPFALALIKQFEGCKLDAYPDPGTGNDPWTIGWGSTGTGVRKGVTWTQAQADQRLAADVAQFGAGVTRLTKGSGHQIGACISLAYNIGLKAFAESTLLKKHNAGDYDGAAAQFAVWNRSGGRVMGGLVRRRSAEARVYQGLPA
jgi:lysozyme